MKASDITSPWKPGIQFAPLGRGLRRRVDERYAGERLQLAERQTRHCLDHLESLRCHVEHREVSEDAVDAADTGQRVAAARDDLRLALLGKVLHHHVNALGADR